MVAPLTPNPLTPNLNAYTNDDSGAALPYEFAYHGTRVSIAGTHVHPQGVPLASVRVAIHADSATDAVPGTALRDSTWSTTSAPGQLYPGPGPTIELYSYVKSGAQFVGHFMNLQRNTWYRYRARTKDSHGEWGPWTSFNVRRFRTNALPTAPTSPSVTAGTLTPDFFGSIFDKDTGAYITAAEVEVYQDPSSGASITKWDSGQVAIGGTSTRFQLAYGGSALAWGTQYRWRARLWDNVAQVGPWGSWLYFTPLEAIGPDGLVPLDFTTKFNTQTPGLTVANSVAFDQYQVQIFNNAAGEGTPLLDSGTVGLGSTTSTTYNVPASTLFWGGRYYWRARVRITGNPNLGEYSPILGLAINTLPGAPVVSVSA